MDGDVLTHFETDYTKSRNKSSINFFLSLSNEVWPFEGDCLTQSRDGSSGEQRTL